MLVVNNFFITNYHDYYSNHLSIKYRRLSNINIIKIVNTQLYKYFISTNKNLFIYKLEGIVDLLKL